jgi:hypothetical protein
LRSLWEAAFSRITLELRFGAVEALSYPSAFFGAGAIPVTERNSIVNSHGDICRKYVILHIARTRYQTSPFQWLKKNGWSRLRFGFWRPGGPVAASPGVCKTQRYMAGSILLTGEAAPDELLRND